MNCAGTSFVPGGLKSTSLIHNCARVVIATNDRTNTNSGGVQRRATAGSARTRCVELNRLVLSYPKTTAKSKRQRVARAFGRAGFVRYSYNTGRKNRK